jgi:hypothetical protein
MEVNTLDVSNTLFIILNIDLMDVTNPYNYILNTDIIRFVIPVTKVYSISYISPNTPIIKELESLSSPLVLPSETLYMVFYNFYAPSETTL